MATRQVLGELAQDWQERSGQAVQITSIGGVDAAKRVPAAMPREHRCTALGGLATTPTAVKLAGRLAERLKR